MKSKIPIIFLICMIATFLIYTFYLSEKEKTKHQEILDYFNSNREQIVSSIEQLIVSGKIQDAFDAIDKYSSIFNDGVFSQLKEKIELEKRKERTNEILSIWKNEIRYFWYRKQDVSYYEDLHEELIKLNPGNEKFIEMQKKFLKKKKEHEEIEKSEKEIEKKEQEIYKKEQEERIAKFGKPPDTEIWGLHGYEGPVMTFLKQRAHNPPSVSIIGCSNLSYTSDGWILFCEYRGQNAFGAMIHDKKAFTIVHGKVTKMENLDEYGY